MFKIENSVVENIIEKNLENFGSAKNDGIYGLMYPKKDKTFVFRKGQPELFKHLIFRGGSGNEIPENVLLVGPQGCGKTETCLQFSSIAGLPVLKINCALVREPRDWFGYKTASDGTVEWVRSEFCKLVERGNAVILLDEISRAAPPILNSLMPLLDGTGQTFLEEVKEIVKRGPNLFFFATANLGSQFTGTYGKLDTALNDRFAVRIECNYLPMHEEAALIVERTGLDPSTAKKLAIVANMTRTHSSGELGGDLSTTISTRNLLDAAELYKTMGQNSFEFSILPLFSSKGGLASQQAKVLQIIQSQFGA